ncbi:MAG: 4-hydroxy-tetrahydrodipicolinate reductase, partial [Chitinophagaceae bacterium]
MKIALIGYGKMGHAIERLAQERGHEIVLRITSKNATELSTGNLKKADVAIEFTNPEVAFDNVCYCLNAGVPVVSGSTGWTEKLQEAKRISVEKQVGLLWASNFSIGVNIFFEVNKLLAKLMERQEGYKASMEEIHHLQKKDAPSGTAITLGEQIIANNNRYENWELGTEAPEGTLAINALREENVPGTHQISWNSAVDKIDIIHTAKSRDGFALGAILAAEFLLGK